MKTQTHSVMFHHFHGDNHKPTQGSLSAGNFRDLINWLRDRYSLIGAAEYLDRAMNGSLDASDVCLSFDDALKCQYDIAVPVMADNKIDAFFFVHSSAFMNNPDFEVDRHFRTSSYDHLEDFYSDFFEAVKAIDAKSFLKHYDLYKNSDYLSAFPFYFIAFQN